MVTSPRLKVKTLGFQPGSAVSIPLYIPIFSSINEDSHCHMGQKQGNIYP